MNEDRNLALRHILDSARKEINRQNAPLAMEYLDSIRHELEELGEGPLWAEHRLLLAEAEGAKGDPAAESLFEEALERIVNLPDTRSDMELRAREHFGDYLLCFAHRPSLAQPQYERAKIIAIESRLFEEGAHISLKLIRVHLEIDHDEELANYKIFRGVASKRGYTHQVQLAGWTVHTGNMGKQQVGMRFARQRTVASEEYFINLLESVRKTST
jgi:hypothetical protein